MRKNNEVQTFWKSGFDLLTALLLILLLIILLLGLYLQDVDEGEEVPDYVAEDNFHGIDGEGEYKEHDDHDDDHPYEDPYEEVIQQASGGGGGEGEGTEPGTQPGTEPDEGAKSAVFVMLVDAETERTVKEAGVTFELYGNDNSLQILNTYYPEKISFRNYETTEAGVFFLPEKIWQGSYYLHELTEASGYDAAENQEFVIDALYDWPEPFVVKVPVSPSKNIIRVEMKDKNTGLAIEGGSFSVVADEDIYTLDETLRYKKGEIVDEIVCDENGYGESKELYLGKYVLREKIVPEYYASNGEEIETEVSKKTGVQPDAEKTLSEKTRIRMRLTDELYTERGIAGASFSVTGPDGTQEYTTDTSGYVNISDLKKNTTYKITQTSSADDYRMDADGYDVYVSTDGRIDGEALYEMALTNRILRVQIGVTEAPFQRQYVPDIAMTIEDESGNIIHEWTSTGAPALFTDLEPGTYFVCRNGKENSKYMISVQDTKDIQDINIRTYTVKSILILVLTGAAAMAGIFGAFRLIMMLFRKRKGKHAGTRNPDQGH